MPSSVAINQISLRRMPSLFPAFLTLLGRIWIELCSILILLRSMRIELGSIPIALGMMWKGLGALRIKIAVVPILFLVLRIWPFVLGRVV